MSYIETMRTKQHVYRLVQYLILPSQWYYYYIIVIIIIIIIYFKRRQHLTLAVWYMSEEKVKDVFK